MRLLRLLPEAKQELSAAAKFYEELQPGLGRALLQEFRRAIQRIAERPMVSRFERGEIRVRSILRFPYRIYYRVMTQQIVVVAFGHRRRRPGYWSTRT